MSELPRFNVQHQNAQVKNVVEDCVDISIEQAVLLGLDISSPFDIIFRLPSNALNSMSCPLGIWPEASMFCTASTAIFLLVTDRAIEPIIRTSCVQRHADLCRIPTMTSTSKYGFRIQLKTYHGKHSCETEMFSMFGSSSRTVRTRTKSVVASSPQLSARSLAPSESPGTGPSVDREGYTVCVPPADALMSQTLSSEGSNLHFHACSGGRARMPESRRS